MLPLRKSTAQAAVHTTADSRPPLHALAHSTCSGCTAVKAVTPMCSVQILQRGFGEAMAPGLVLLCMLLPTKTTVEQTARVEGSDDDDNHVCVCVCVSERLKHENKGNIFVAI